MDPARGGDVSDRCFIAAKAPRPGLAKTRLAAAIGQARALELYRAFLHDLADRFSAAPFALGWYVTPPDAWSDLAPLVRRAGSTPRIVAQPAGDWGERQAALFRTAPLRDEARTVLIASDSPQVTPAVVEEAFAALDHADLVLGPTLDGGYYLIGMRGRHDLLAGVPMSTGDVLGRILSRAAARGCTAAVLETTFDVDEAADLVPLAALAASRDDMPATRRALARPIGAAA